MPPGRPVLSLAHSPDSDDLVMWWPLAGFEGPGGGPAIDTGRFEFRCCAEDVQALNRRAIERGDHDITAVSAATYPAIADRYAITSCGGSFGEGYGPKLVVSRSGHTVQSPGTRLRIAVPGRNTTAFLVLSLMLGPGTFDAREMVFSEIPDAVAAGEVDAGLLIHEAQLTFESLGLVAVADLGVWWRDTAGVPLPLGLNVVRRDLDARFGPGACAEIARTLASSIRYAMEHPDLSRAFLLSRSADRPEWRDPGLLDRYLAMYVSPLTVDMGERGRAALRGLYADAHDAGLCGSMPAIDVL